MEHRFELSIPADVVLADLTSADFLTAFATEVGVEVGSLTSSASGEDPAGQARASMTWSFPTDRPGIPQLARTLLPDRVELTWEQAWGLLEGDTARGTLEVQLTGRPSAVSNGTCRLVVDGSGCALTTDTTTKAALPFPVRGKVESTIDRELVGWILSVQARVLTRRHPG
ncbi:MAG: DUF2505 domain-containing protein [Candidatus Nanopelagicales bacterium]